MQMNYTPTYLDYSGMTFNPRLMLVDQDHRCSTTSAFRAIDQTCKTIKIVNFTKQFCTIAYRDGVVSSLKYTPPEDAINKIHGYASANEINPNGSFDYPRGYKRSSAFEELETSLQHQRLPRMEPGIYVCVEYTLTQRAHRGKDTIIPDSKLLYRDHERVLNKATKAFREYYKEHLAVPQYGDGKVIYNYMSANLDRTNGKMRPIERFCYEFFVAEEDIRDAHNGMLYIEQVDLVLSLTMPIDEVYHPYTEEGKKRFAEDGLCTKVKQGLNRSTVISVVNVDNRPAIYGTEFYFNIGGAVFAVKTVKDIQRKNGIYYFVNDDSDRSKEEKHIYIPHEKAINHGIEGVPEFYPSAESARTHGDLKARELKEHEEKMAKARLETEEIKQENEKAKQQTVSVKETAEQRSTQRKDASETVKWVSTVVGAVVGIVVGVLSSRTKLFGFL